MRTASVLWRKDASLSRATAVVVASAVQLTLTRDGRRAVVGALAGTGRSDWTLSARELFSRLWLIQNRRVPSSVRNSSSSDLMGDGLRRVVEHAYVIVVEPLAQHRDLQRGRHERHQDRLGAARTYSVATPNSTSMTRRVLVVAQHVRQHQHVQK